jgi:hypothetical protein
MDPAAPIEAVETMDLVFVLEGTGGAKGEIKINSTHTLADARELILEEYGDYIPSKDFFRPFLN